MMQIFYMLTFIALVIGSFFVDSYEKSALMIVAAFLFRLCGYAEEILSRLKEKQ